MVLSALPVRVAVVTLQLLTHSVVVACTGREYASTATAIGGSSAYLVAVNRLANRCKHSAYLQPARLFSCRRPQKARKSMMASTQCGDGSCGCLQEPAATRTVIVPVRHVVFIEPGTSCLEEKWSILPH